MRVRRFLAASLVAALLLGASGMAKAEPVTIHAGWLVVPNMIFPLMPMKPEVLRHTENPTFSISSISPARRRRSLRLRPRSSNGLSPRRIPIAIRRACPM